MFIFILYHRSLKARYRNPGIFEMSENLQNKFSWTWLGLVGPWPGPGRALVGPWSGHGTAMARPGPDIVKKYQTWSTHRHWSTSLNRNQTKLPRQPIFSSVCSQMAVLIKYLGVRYTIVPTWRILTQARGQAARDRKTEPETRKQRRHLWRIFCTSINGYTNNLRF